MYWVGALISQTVVKAMTGKHVDIKEFLPIPAAEMKPQLKQTPEQMVRALRIATGT